MKKNKIRQNPYFIGIVITVVGTIIAHFVVNSFSNFNLLDTIFDFLDTIFDFLIYQTISLPWLIFIIISFMSLILILMFFALRMKSDEKPKFYELFKEYKDDLGINWIINYQLYSNNIDDIRPFCPYCRVDLNNNIEFETCVCPLCKKRFVINDQYDKYRQLIITKIISLINTGQWITLIKNPVK